MTIKWVEILKKSFEHLKEYKFLWVLGVLAALTEGGAGGGYSSGGGSNGWSGNDKDFEKFGNTAFDWISRHSFEIAIIIGAIFIISIIILYISYSARAGLIYSADKLEEGEKIDFPKAFHAGQKYFWRFLGLTILIAFIMFAVIMAAIIIVGGLVLVSIAVSLWLLVIVVPIGIASILGFIVLAIYLGLILNLSYRSIVIQNSSITEAVDRSRKLFHHNMANILIAWLIQAAIGVAVGIGLLVVSLVAAGVLFAIGVGVFFSGGLIAAVIYGSIAALAFVAFVLAVSGASNAYISTFWTLTYKTLSTKS